MESCALTKSIKDAITFIEELFENNEEVDILLDIIDQMSSENFADDE